MQFWDYEVRDKFAVVTSTIDRSLGILPSVNTRCCNVVTDSASSNAFFKDYSVVEPRGNIAIGLEQGGRLVCCADVNYSGSQVEILSISIASKIHVSNVVEILVDYLSQKFDANYILLLIYELAHLLNF